MGACKLRREVSEKIGRWGKGGRGVIEMEDEGGKREGREGREE